MTCLIENGLAPTITRREPEDIKYVILHHSATASGNVETFRRYHVDQLGYGDVGYHFIVCNGNGGSDGELQEGRPILMTGAHAYGRNKDSIGVCLVGNFTKTMPTEAQMETLYTLLQKLVKRYSISPDHVLGHNEVCSTDCPGNLDVAAIRYNLSRPPVPKVRINGVDIDGVIIGNRLYAPIRETLEVINRSMGFNVEWDTNTRVAKITFGKGE
jgi:hypothetical protein